LLLDHIGGHNLKVKYDWFGNNQEPETAPTLQRQDVDTGYLREWQLIKMDGTDLISTGTG
jgi:hypothetical protein